MKVYVITKGSYSDYGICAVAIDHQKAEVLRQLCSDKWDEAFIEEYDTDEFVPVFERKLPYRVWFDASGSVEKVELQSLEYFKTGVDKQFVWDKVNETHRVRVTVGLYAENEERAIKVAAEKRAEYIAEEFGL